MSDWTALIVPITLAVFAIGVIVVLTPRVVRSKQDQRIAMMCPLCQHPIRSSVGELARLTPNETGFVVRERPEAYGRPLGELHCPSCEASHVYAVDRFPPEFLVTNPISATARKNSCAQCRAPLRAPAWPRGAFDGRLIEAPKLDPKHGLVCGQCGAIVCVQCSQEASRGRTAENVLRCPRCFRVPMVKFHHF